jgi:hypothetical protein
MTEHPALTPFFQKRFVCPNHGYFDVRLSIKPTTSFIAKCPTCSEPALEREGFECSGRTAGPIPHVTRPRIEEMTVYEFPSYENKGFQQARKKRNTRKK